MDITLITDWLLKIGYWILEIGACCLVGWILACIFGSLLGYHLTTFIFDKDEKKSDILLGTKNFYLGILTILVAVCFLLRKIHFSSFEYVLTSILFLFNFCIIVKSIFVEKLQSLKVCSLFNADYILGVKVSNTLQNKQLREDFDSILNLTVYDALGKAYKAQKEGKLNEEGLYILKEGEEWG
jgi:hypothetical protein